MPTAFPEMYTKPIHTAQLDIAPDKHSTQPEKPRMPDPRPGKHLLPSAVAERAKRAEPPVPVRPPARPLARLPARPLARPPAHPLLLCCPLTDPPARSHTHHIMTLSTHLLADAPLPKSILACFTPSYPQIHKNPGPKSLGDPLIAATWGKDTSVNQFFPEDPQPGTHNFWAQVCLFINKQLGPRFCVSRISSAKMSVFFLPESVSRVCPGWVFLKKCFWLG